MSGGLPDIDGIPLPWQTDAWQQLCESLTNGKLPHALLLSGVAGTGKQLFAHAFARLALCQQPKADRACASCPACHQFLAGAHPDYFAVGVLQERTTIMVEQIRALSASLALTSRQGGRKFALLAPADAMQAAAANSLLKTLEEPPADTFLLLVTAHSARLPATIRSRCRQLRMPAPAQAMARRWLDEMETRSDWDALLGVAGGGPLLARQLAQTGFVQQRLMFYHLLAELRAGRRDPVTSAAALKQEDTEAVLRFMQSWVMDLITQHAAAGDRVQIINTDARELLQTAGHGINLRALHAYLGRLYEAMALAGSSVNTRLLLESLLVEWADGLRTLETAPLAARGGRT